MFFKGIFSKVSNVAKMDFDDKREQAIYNLGVDAGERRVLDRQRDLEAGVFL